jgi:exopolysaccharide biosynthesis polyprenyl glycosylphosphotransferase
MTDPHSQNLVAYWSKAGTRRGRALIHTRLWLKTAVWRGVLAGSLAIKRALDIAAGTLGLLALSPLLLTVMVLIKLEDGGPLFFQQKRVGLRGRLFGMWKFRSMVLNADALKDTLLQSNEMKGGVTFKMKNDPRITRVGKYLRKFSIDEMPQLWNVFRGEMSLVGPRPPVPREVQEYTVEERQRLLAKPGLTCFWQVGGRSDIDFNGQVRLDVEYIKSRSLWLDIKLLFKTVPAVLLGKGAY